MALRAGFDPARIHMHGNNKTEAELRLRGRGRGRPPDLSTRFDEIDAPRRDLLDRAARTC